MSGDPDGGRVHRAARRSVDGPSGVRLWAPTLARASGGDIMAAMDDHRYPLGRFKAPDEYTPALCAEYIAQVDEAPRRLRAAVARLSAEQLQTPYRDDGWTVAQVVHHLPDSHMNSYVRFRLALTETEPTVKPYDESAWARLPDAAGSDLEPSLVLLDGLHRRWINLLRRLTPDDWRRCLIHPERGRVTLDNDLAL